MCCGKDAVCQGAAMGATALIAGLSAVQKVLITFRGGVIVARSKKSPCYDMPDWEAFTTSHVLSPLLKMWRSESNPIGEEACSKMLGYCFDPTSPESPISVERGLYLRRLSSRTFAECINCGGASAVAAVLISSDTPMPASTRVRLHTTLL